MTKKGLFSIHLSLKQYSKIKFQIRLILNKLKINLHNFKVSYLFIREAFLTVFGISCGTRTNIVKLKTDNK